MSNSCKLIKFAPLQKLANQSRFNRTHMKEITKTCTVVLMEARNPLIFDIEINVSVEKKTEDCKNILFKALANTIWLTSKLIRRVKEHQTRLWTTFY